MYFYFSTSISNTKAVLFDEMFDGKLNGKKFSKMSSKKFSFSLIFVAFFFLFLTKRVETFIGIFLRLLKKKKNILARLDMKDLK